MATASVVRITPDSAATITAINNAITTLRDPTGANLANITMVPHLHKNRLVLIGSTGINPVGSVVKAIALTRQHITESNLASLEALIAAEFETDNALSWESVETAFGYTILLGRNQIGGLGTWVSAFQAYTQVSPVIQAAPATTNVDIAYPGTLPRDHSGIYVGIHLNPEGPARYNIVHQPNGGGAVRNDFGTLVFDNNNVATGTAPTPQNPSIIVYTVIPAADAGALRLVVSTETAGDPVGTLVINVKQIGYWI